MEEIKNQTNSVRSNDLNSIHKPLVPPVPSTSPTTKTPKKISKSILLLIIITCIIVTVSIASAFYFYQKSQNPTSNQIIPEETPTSIPTLSDNNTANVSNVIWLDKPQKISSLDIFVSKSQVGEEKENESYEIIYFNKASFYLIGNLSDGSQLIKVFLPTKQDGPGGDGDLIYEIIKSPDGQITLMIPEEDASTANTDKYFSKQIAIDYGSYPELNPPNSLLVNGISLDKDYCYPSDNFETLSNPIIFGSTNNGDLYTINEVSGIDGIVTRRFYLKLKDWSYCVYHLKYDFVSDDQSLLINWNDGSSVTDQFNSDFIRGQGCGSILGKNDGSEIIEKDSVLLQNKVAVATYNGTIFYQIKDTNSSIVKYLYQEYKSRFYSPTPPELTIEEFAQNKNHILYQDSTGNWVIFTNTQYGSMAECGKPVIYLYPQTETQIKVQVSAQITKSEPTYPLQGWLVTAKPNGELTYQNQSYPYLFWEGLGNGIYPDYQDQGTLVSQKDLVSTVYKQLSQLGLNQKESADFMEFWQPKLPETPYVRLTWLNTQDMDRLAPLAVNPKPDTKIRIFLEFEGLEKPITLKPQKLTAPERNGFTLIEWGGLLLKARE